MNSLFTQVYGELWQNTDISEHLPILFMLASQSETIVEFGVRSGRSTKAFLAGQATNPNPTKLFSYDINACGNVITHGSWDERTYWQFEQADTGRLGRIPECNLLFIDTLHTYEQVEKELRYHSFVNRWIVLHDTLLFGIDGEGGPGIRPAIFTFLDRNPVWRMAKEYQHNNGLMILERK